MSRSAPTRAPAEEPAQPGGRMESAMGSLLRVGVTAAAVLVLVGGVIYLKRHGGELSHHDVFHGEPPDLCGMSGIVRRALSLSGRGVIQLGLLVLIATPILRVIFGLVGFALQRDRVFVVVTLLVLAVMAASFFLSASL